jgi:basic membrane lipoprotein Med (substrate-binding protein (PBP1-ABC) superfamily)
VMDKYNQGLIPEEAIKQTEEARQKIIKGEIKVTDAMMK